jgi:cytoskeletal protein RodZ
MTSFIHKKLSTSKSLPEIIKEERQKINLSLEDVSIKTQVCLSYLKELERGDYHKLPGDVYVKQFIKKLARLFKFSEKALLEIYQKEREAQLTFFRPRPLAIPKRNLLSFLSPKLIKVFFICLIITGLFGYLAWEIKNIFTPPFLEIEAPASQTITQNSTVAIKGKVRPEATVQINHQEILIKPDGSFSQEVDLNIGLNLFEITASKKHSKQRTVNISILRQPATVNTIDKSVSIN